MQFLIFSFSSFRSPKISLREKYPNMEFFLVRIFPYSDWIRRDTPYLSVFSPNAGKEILRISSYSVRMRENTDQIFGLNTKRYSVSLRIQSEWGKIRTTQWHFSRSDFLSINCIEPIDNKKTNKCFVYWPNVCIT